MRPHQRRALPAPTPGDTEMFGHLTPPTLDTLEALERAFPVSLPELTNGGMDGLVQVSCHVHRMHGQQEVIQFLRNLAAQARGE